MSDKTGIEWTDATWNPTTGCDQVSPGCDNCYALTMAKRLKAMGSPRYQNDGDPATSGPGFGLTMHPDALEQPLRWTKPRRIFVNSMSDLFHKDVTDQFIVRVFAIMALAPQHTFQVLTKRHARMKSLIGRKEYIRTPSGWISFEDAVRNTAFNERNRLCSTRVIPLSTPNPDHIAWPLENVWLGVSVEDQQWADIRVHALVDTPAAVRFLSCEPLLGPVDISAWLPPRTLMRPEDAPRLWADWTWPEWVPTAICEAIEAFWSEKYGRGPHAWLRSSYEQEAPPFGAMVTLGDGFSANPTPVTGRFVHVWNNIGRLVMDDGTFRYTSFGPSDHRPAIDWVIAGGESGRRSRPMHPDWVRSLHDQCEAAGSAFLFKQWGEWVTEDQSPEDITLPAVSYSHFGDDEPSVYKVGKHAAGRELDGRTWDQYPTEIRSIA